MNSKQKLLLVHRWVGLVLAALFLVQGVTGALLVFRDSIERLIHEELTVAQNVSRVPVQKLVEAVREAAPLATMKRMEFAKDDGGAVIFHMTVDGGHSPYLVAVDPYTGAIVRQGGAGVWPTEWLFLLHDTLLAGKMGELILGIEGVLLAFIAVTGLYIWWPGLARWRNGFKVHLKSGPDRAIRTLHRASGAVVALILISNAATGAMMIFKPQIIPAVSLVGFTPKPSAKVVAPSDAFRLSVDELIENARRDYGDTALREVRFLGAAGQVIAIYLREDQSVRENATKQISYNAYTGEEIGAYVPSALPLGNGFVDWLYPVHTGRGAGVVGQLFVLGGGLGLIFFSLSGVWLWFSRRSRQAGARRARSSPGTLTGA